MFDILKSVARHFLVYGSGILLNRIVAFILIPVYTHYLATAEYGTLELLQLTTYVASMFLSMGISSAILRYYFEADDLTGQKEVVSTAFFSVWGLAVVGTLVLLACSPGISILVFKSTDNTSLFDFFNK